MNHEEIITKVKALAPWHMNIGVTSDIYTGDFSKNPSNKQEINLIDPTKMSRDFNRLYGQGLVGKRVLDVGCNAGGYCFLANEMGAKFTYGFDPRSHWIDQALFIQQQRNIPYTHMRFEQHDLRKLESADIGNFDFTLFKGVFYHLSDPIRAVEMLASKTKDYMIIDSGCDLDIPEESMISKFEGTQQLMSGVEGLSWYPGGPKVILNICKQFGFKFGKVLYFRKNLNDKRSFTRDNLGRCAVLVSRTEELLNAYKSAK